MFVIQHNPDATRIAISHQCKLDRVQPGTTALYHCKHDMIKSVFFAISCLLSAEWE